MYLMCFITLLCYEWNFKLEAVLLTALGKCLKILNGLTERIVLYANRKTFMFLAALAIATVSSWIFHTRSYLNYKGI